MIDPLRTSPIASTPGTLVSSSIGCREECPSPKAPGWVLLFAGITTVVHAVSNRTPLRGLEAIVTIVAGLYLLIFPLSGTVTLTFVLAIWFFATGVFSLMAALQNRGAPESGMALFGGVVSLLLGVLIAVELPSSAAWAIGLLVGINLIFWSVRALIGARILKQRLLSS